MAILGLVLIVIGWSLQVISLPKQKTLNQNFLVLYALGAAFLVADGLFRSWLIGGIDGLVSGISLSTVLNISAAFLALVALIKIRA